MQYKSLLGYFELIRIPNCLIIAFATLTGYLVALHKGSFDIDFRVIILMISSFFIAAGGNVINDYFDIDIDRINKPNRPLPSGIISPKKAYKLAISLFILGSLLSLFTSLYCFIVAMIASFLLFYYSKSLKRKGLVGNLTIAFLSALNLIYGGLLAEHFYLSIIPSFYAFTIILGREIVKTIEDYEGDSAKGVKSLPVLIGIKKSSIIALIVLLILIGISPIPFVTRMYSYSYLLIAILGVDLPIAISLYILLVVGDASTSKKILKIPLALGLLAFFLGEVIKY